MPIPLNDETTSRPWLQHYPPGVPARVAIDAYATLPDLLEESFRKYASRDAAACMGQLLKFRDIDEMSLAFGAWLQSRGLKRGSRVAVMMPNVPQYMVAIAAVLRAGYVVVNVNPLYTPRELEHQLKDSGARGDRHPGELRVDARGGDRRAPHVRHVVLASMGDLLGFWKGQLVNFAVRHLRKMVPEFELAARTADAASHASTWRWPTARA